MAPLISIITPHFNMGDTVGKSLTSVPEDCVHTVEHIVVDDFSDQEHYVKLCKHALSRSNIKVIRNTKNLGPVNTCNKAAKMAVGKYIIFLSADDWLDRDFIRYLVEKVLIEHDYGIIFGDVSISYKDHNTPKRVRSLKVTSDLFVPPPALNILDDIRSSIHGLAVIRRDLFEECGRYEEKLKWNTDLFLHVKISTKAGILYVPKVMGYFTKNSNSYGNKKTYAEQKSSFDILFSYLEDPQNILVLNVYCRSGILGKEPYSLRYIVIQRKLALLNINFILKHLIYKTRRLVLKSIININRPNN